MKILIVDDDQFVLQVMSAVLAAAGHSDVTLARSAKDAVCTITAASQPFDLCLVDITMPDIDGIELCRWIRNEPNYRAIPILMVTAKADKIHIDRAFAAGATEYVTKPIDVEEFQRAVSQYAVSADKDEGQPEMAAAPDGAGKSPAERRIDFHQGIRLPEVPHILDYKALQNYVLAISRIGLLDTRIFAFKVKGVGKIYAGATSEDFVSVLTCVAQSISGSMKTSEFFLAYAGEGAFVCVARGRTAQNLGKIEQDTNRRIRRAHLTDSAGIPIDAPVRVGPQIRGGLIRSGQSVVDAMQVAITKAEERTCLESDDDESKSALFELFDVLMPYNTVLRPKSAVAQVNNHQTERALAAAFRAASTEH